MAPSLPVSRRLTAALAALALTATAVALGGGDPAPTAQAQAPLFKGPKIPKVVDIVRSAENPAVIAARLKRYVDVPLGVVPSKIPAEIRPMLKPLKDAADAIDRVYWRQISPNGWGVLQALSKSKAKVSKDLARYLRIHYGFWDRHRDDKPFIGQQTRPPGANFYPPDLSRREMDGYLGAHPEKAAALWSPYTVVRRRDGSLEGIPYSQAYRADLATAALALKEAASAYTCKAPGGSDDHPCPCAALSRFLVARGESFKDDDYRRSEYLWMDSAACPLEVAIGPYEYYEDRLFGLKTAFEAIISIRDEPESARFARLLTFHQQLFDNLPIEPALRRRFKLVRPSPITVADVLYTSGEARAGYQIRAFLLPNDEAVRRTRGTKNVILRNVVRAKFDHLVVPVAKRIFGPDEVGKLSFDAYFDNLLTWQLAHSVVPSDIVLPGGSRTSPRQQLRERYPIVDMVRGEIIALLNYFYLVDKGALSEPQEGQMAVTYLASLMDSVRLTGGSPQTIAKVIIYNYFAREWVVRYNPRSRTFEVNPPALRRAVRKLARETLEILGRGDYDGAGRLVVEYGIMPAELRTKINELSDLPLDIVPHYTSL